MYTHDTTCLEKKSYNKDNNCEKIE